MNYMTLINVDNVTKLLVIDPYIGFKSRKIKFRDISLSSDFEVETKVAITSFLTEFDIEAAASALILIAEKYRLFYFYSISTKKWLYEHIKLYLLLIHKDSLVQIKECNRYTLDNNKGFKVVAVNDLKKNQKINYLSGVYTKLTNEEENLLTEDILDFSIAYSTRHNSNVLLLGPVAFVNHDCQPNCAYSVESNNKIVLKVLKAVKAGEELYVYYGKDYFDNKNKSCECITCEFKHIQSECSKFGLQLDLEASTILISNMKKFQTFVQTLSLTKSILCKKSQRRQTNMVQKGLKYDNGLYTSLITYLNDSAIAIDSDCLKFNDKQLKEIVIHTYKRYHSKNLKTVKNFISIYRKDIKEDLKGFTGVQLLAPETKRQDSYIKKLIIVSLLLCYEEYALCIYMGKKIVYEKKQSILKKMYKLYTKKDKEKLDNYLNMYNTYLQQETEKVINFILNKSRIQIGEKQPTPTLKCKSIENFIIVKEEKSWVGSKRLKTSESLENINLESVIDENKSPVVSLTRLPNLLNNSISINTDSSLPIDSFSNISDNTIKEILGLN